MSGEELHATGQLFESEEGRPLDPEVEARRNAALRLIRTFGDPVLRAKAIPVDRFDSRLGDEIERMSAIMKDAIGVGLAATQLGVMHRLFTYHTDPEGPISALVNPEIVWRSDETEEGVEGCLSLPGVIVTVERPLAVKAKAFDRAGDPLEVEAEGLEARVIQHEMDHLDGVLIVDRIDPEQRRAAMRILRGAAPPRSLRRGDEESQDEALDTQEAAAAGSG